MRAIDPGHVFELAHLDGNGVQILTFVKREGEGYPGNVGHHEGTNLQEVLRALISRVKYLHGQIPHEGNGRVIINLRVALVELELRAAQRHGRKLVLDHRLSIEDHPVCESCGHIGCSGNCHGKEK